MIKKTNRKKVVHCNLNELCTSVVFNPDIVVLVHAPKSCSNIIFNGITNMRQRINLRFNKKLPPAIDNIFVTGISDKEAIFGGEKLLKNSIELLVNEKKPKCLLVVSGCTAGVIGDDVSTICEDLSSKYKIPITHIPGAGFMSVQNKEGLILATEYLYKLVADNTETKDEKLAVLVGLNKYVQTSQQEAELRRLFEYFGFTKILMPPCGMSMDELKQINRASLIAVHALTKEKLLMNQKFGRYLSDYLGVPLIENRLPFSRVELHKYLKKLGIVCNNSCLAEKAIEAEEKRWLEGCSVLKKEMLGISYILSIGHSFRVTDPFQIIRCMDAVGMTLEKIIYLDNLTDKDILEYEKLVVDKNISVTREKEQNYNSSDSNILVITSDYRTIFKRQYCYKRKRIGVGGALNLIEGVHDLITNGGTLKYE
ncbi:MAG: nitrogenase component 1 [Phascolarctobacterium sp.]|nr:nitrogenase component 1 [Phascolarctobacterium sp.]MEE1229991.1 nitrogenase component 1 [Phascolarctobacterium sp.]